MKAENIGLIILAAGGSFRLARPKQLLIYKGITMLKHSIQVGIDSMAETIIIVLGAHADKMTKEIAEYNVETIINTEWEEGMGSSIRVGLQALIKAHQEVTGTVIMLCDQPFITSTLINELIVCHQNTGKPIIASTYGDVIGVPAWFHKDVFPYLMQLNGDQGAKAVIQQHSKDVSTVPFPKGSVDIDTELDYNALMKVVR